MDTAAFAREWVEAWNAHDLERILSHYSEDVVLVSPIAVARLGRASGRIEGKADLRAYFAKGLAARPDMRFTLRRVLDGVSSMVVDYVAADGRDAAEWMEFDGEGRVCAVRAHYSGGR